MDNLNEDSHMQPTSPPPPPNFEQNMEPGVAGMEHHPQPQLAPGLYVLDLEKPGEAHCGRGVGEALDVIRALEAHGIPCCVAGVKALVYYGAHRVPMNWEICVPTDSIERAKGLLASTPLSDKYELWHPVMPDVHSLAHTYPRFTLKGVNFFFILMPAFECRVDCSPDQCERSPSGIPYPKLERLAQGLLDTQLYADLTDLVDGMDLDEAWGETHLQLDGPPPIDYIREKNERIARALPASMKGEALLALLSERPRAREVWLRVVSTKQRRINDKMPRPRHLTRFRKIGSPDPREKQGREV